MHDGLESHTGRRTADVDPFAKWDFPRQSAGIASRILAAARGEVLEFREGTGNVFVAGDSGLTWREVFYELVEKGALHALPHRGRHVYVRGAAAIDTVWALENFATPKSEMPGDPPQQWREVPKEHNLWPKWFHAGFFVSGAEISVDIQEIRRVARIVMDCEASLFPPGHPPFSGAIDIQIGAPRSFNQVMVSLPYEASQQGSSFAGGKKYLLDRGTDSATILLVERPYLGYRNSLRAVYAFGAADSVSREPLPGYLLDKLCENHLRNDCEEITLYRGMSEARESPLWENRDFEELVASGYSQLSQSRDGRINFGYEEPRWQSSVGKVPWGTMLNDTALWRLTCQVNVLQELRSHGAVDVGIGLGDAKHGDPLRIGTMVEVVLSPHALELLAQELRRNSRAGDISLTRVL